MAGGQSLSDWDKSGFPHGGDAPVMAGEAGEACGCYEESQL